MERRSGRLRADFHGDEATEQGEKPRPGRLDRRPRRKADSIERGESDAAAADDVIIVIPVFNDWSSLAQLLPRLDATLSAHFLRANVLIVDDGSTAKPEIELETPSFAAIRNIDVLTLRRNLGHQRAIAIGLAYVEDCLQTGPVVVMDADGEDDPADVPRLLERLDEVGNDAIVFAERTRRSESLGFRIFYALYKLAHYLLTGKGVRVGNFSVIPRGRLTSLVVVSELWNHYAAAVIRSRQPFCMVPTRRARRLCGHSSMNFVSLVTHGLSAISVYSDVVGVRLLVLSILLAIVTVAGMIGALLVRLATNLAIPGWASYTIGILLILFSQAIMAAFVFSFVSLGSRQGTTFLPSRDYSFYIGRSWTWHAPANTRAVVPVRTNQSEALISGT